MGVTKIRTNSGTEHRDSLRFKTSNIVASRRPVIDNNQHMVAGRRPADAKKATWSPADARRLKSRATHTKSALRQTGCVR